MPRQRPPYLQRERTRHGLIAWYVRIGDGPRTRIHGEYGSHEFMAAYHSAVNGQQIARAPEHSHRKLWDEYRKSSAWQSLAYRVKQQREGIMRPVIEKHGDTDISEVTRKTIRLAVEQRTGSARGAFLKAMRGWFRWMLDMELVDEDPTRDVRAPDAKTDGHHTWTADEINAYMKRWPLGTRERLALDLLLYTGLRGSDFVRLGPEHVKDDVITIHTKKTGEVAVIPILRPLAASIAAIPAEKTFFVGDRGEPITSQYFRKLFARACEAAGVPGRAHGLRKALATILAENGATTMQLDALFAWKGGQTSRIYTRKADKKRLARAAIDLFSIPAPSEIAPHLLDKSDT
jgi:integrase